MWSCIGYSSRVFQQGLVVFRLWACNWREWNHSCSVSHQVPQRQNRLSPPSFRPLPSIFFHLFLSLLFKEICKRRQETWKKHKPVAVSQAPPDYTAEVQLKWCFLSANSTVHVTSHRCLTSEFFQRNISANQTSVQSPNCLTKLCSSISLQFCTFVTSG